MKRQIIPSLRKSGATNFHCKRVPLYVISRIVERQPIVFGQPPEWYTRFEEIREQRRLDKLMPPVDKVAAEILNAREEKFESEDKDQLVASFLRPEV